MPYVFLPSRIIGLLPDPLRRRHSNAVRPPPGTSPFVRRPSVDVPRRAQGQQLADVDADVVVLQPATPEETARTPVISRPLPPTPPPNDLAPVGARLALFHLRWLDVITDPWVQTVVTEGLRISFSSPPPLTRSPQWISVPRAPARAAALRAEVQALLLKRAVEEVTDPASPGFYSHLFVVPKPGGRWRPVIDLSALNRLIAAPAFRMETPRALRASVHPAEFAVSLDLTDAYLHVPMHRSTRRYLRFAIDGKVFAFRALPFGLNLSPWAFTRLMDAVMGLVRRQTSSEVSNYLDDLLQKNTNPEVLRADLAVMQSTLQRLGWLVNLEKSDLIPSQVFSHLGMLFRTLPATVELTAKRRNKLLTAVRQLQTQTLTTPREIAMVIGLCSSAAELVPSGRLAVRPLQWAFQDLWRPTSQDWDVILPLSEDLRRALTPWTRELWLSSAVPISPPPPDVSLCTDASLSGWGAHLLPTFETAHGIWSPEESLLHINLLELLAVFRALLCWYEKLRGRAVMLLTDNTTVVAYVNIRAGPAPDSCASWSSSSFSGAVRPALPSMSATSQDDLTSSPTVCLALALCRRNGS